MLATQKKKAAESATQRPIAGKNIILFPVYHDRQKSASQRALASFVGTNQEFQRYLREGEISCLL